MHVTPVEDDPARSPRPRARRRRRSRPSARASPGVSIEASPSSCTTSSPPAASSPAFRASTTPPPCSRSISLKLAEAPGVAPAAQDVEAAVGRPVIDHDQLEVVVARVRARRSSTRSSTGALSRFGSSRVTRAGRLPHRASRGRVARWEAGARAAMRAPRVGGGTRRSPRRGRAGAPPATRPPTVLPEQPSGPGRGCSTRRTEPGYGAVDPGAAGAPDDLLGEEAADRLPARVHHRRVLAALDLPAGLSQPVGEVGVLGRPDLSRKPPTARRRLAPAGDVGGLGIAPVAEVERVVLAHLPGAGGRSARWRARRRAARLVDHAAARRPVRVRRRRVEVAVEQVGPRLACRRRRKTSQSALPLERLRGCGRRRAWSRDVARVRRFPGCCRSTRRRSRPRLATGPRALSHRRGGAPRAAPERHDHVHGGRSTSA